MVWQWEGDTQGQWHNYDLQVSIVIEDYFSQNAANLGHLDLSKTPMKLPYILDLKNMTQKRIETGRIRNLRREVLSAQYTLLNGNSSTGDLASNSQQQTVPKRRISVNVLNRGSTVGPSGGKKAKFGYFKSGDQASTSTNHGANNTSQSQGQQSVAASSLNSQNGPITRKKLNYMMARQNFQQNGAHGGGQSSSNSQTQQQSQQTQNQNHVQNSGHSISHVQNPGHSQSHMQNPGFSQNHVQNQGHFPSHLQNSGHLPSNPIQYLQNLQMTSHHLLHPGTAQFLSQFGPPSSGLHVISGGTQSNVVSIHGGSNPG